MIFVTTIHLFKLRHKVYSRDSELVVLVQGPRPENILFLVHEVFEGLIVESFHGVQYDFMLPCPECSRMVRLFAYHIAFFLVLFEPHTI